MKKNITFALLTAVAVTSASAVQYNQNITAIFGGGNPDTGWTTETAGGITLGLRAKDRTSGATPNVDGVYTFATAPAPRGLWNYEFSINSGTAPLTAYTFLLSVDNDSSLGTSFTTINPLTYWGDNFYGTAATGNGLGDEGLFAVLGGNNQIAQNSQNITFGDYPGGAMPLELNATYDYILTALDQAGNTIASVSIQVVVGNGGARVPDAGSTFAFLGAGLAALAGLRRKLSL